MANFYLSILFVGLNACFILSSSFDFDQHSAPTEVPSGVHYIEDLEEYKDAFKKMESMRNDKRIKLPATEHLCHNAHAECVKTVTNTGPVCAHHGRYGLVNFPSLCEIRLPNCLSGKKSKYGKFYYNGQRQGCDYYVKKTKTIPDAVKQYFSEDINKDFNVYLAEEEGKKEKSTVE